MSMTLFMGVRIFVAHVREEFGLCPFCKKRSFGGGFEIKLTLLYLRNVGTCADEEAVLRRRFWSIPIARRRAVALSHETPPSDG